MEKLEEKISVLDKIISKLKNDVGPLQTYKEKYQVLIFVLGSDYFNELWNDDRGLMSFNNNKYVPEPGAVWKFNISGYTILAVHYPINGHFEAHGFKGF